MSLSNLKTSHRVLNSHIFYIDRGTEVSFAVASAVFSENGPFVLMLFQKLDCVTHGRQVQKSDRLNSDRQSGSDQLGSTRIE